MQLDRSAAAHAAAASSGTCCARPSHTSAGGGTGCAAPLGGIGVRVNTRHEFAAALERAMAERGRFQLIDATLPLAIRALVPYLLSQRRRLRCAGAAPNLAADDDERRALDVLAEGGATCEGRTRLAKELWEREPLAPSSPGNPGAEPGEIARIAVVVWNGSDTSTWEMRRAANC